MKGKRLIYSLPVKIIWYLLSVAALGIFLACAIGVYIINGGNFYYKSAEDVKKEACENNYWMINDASNLLVLIISGEEEEALRYCESTNLMYEAYDEDGRKIFGNYPGSIDEPLESASSAVNVYFSDIAPYTVKARQYLEQMDAEDATIIRHYMLDNESWLFKLYIDYSFPKIDKYAVMCSLIEFIYNCRYTVYPVGIASLLLFLFGLGFLLRIAGHRPGSTDIREGMFTRAPFDLLTFLGAAVTYVLLAICSDGSVYGYSVYLIFAAVPVIFMVPAYCMSIAVRIKLGILWKNTLIFRFLNPLLCAGKRAGKGIIWLAKRLPMVWKTVLLLTLLSIMEIMVYALAYWEYDTILILWALEKILLLAALLYLALILNGLLKGGEALAAGDLSSQVDMGRMPSAFRQHGQDLNSIGAGMNRAVEERMKSEHLKTELITNVSHDIKTPLTSIINYADLIRRETTENTSITECAEKLYRQSDRLKKLIENMVEASKANTGNMEASLVPCEVGVLLVQTAGEYEQRLEERQLQLITRQPEAAVRILADGKHLWKVFDRLMSNVCSHSLPGTRVYLDVEVWKEDVFITFKNASKEPLDISAEEFMERFAGESRAKGKTTDSSTDRTTDMPKDEAGIGLGLSIARSLTELQNGKFEISIDGDLFKVNLVFKSI